MQVSHWPGPCPVSLRLSRSAVLVDDCTHLFRKKLDFSPLGVASGLIPPSNTGVCLSVHFPGGRFSGLARSAIDPVFTPG